MFNQIEKFHASTERNNDAYDEDTMAQQNTLVSYKLFLKN